MENGERPATKQDIGEVRTEVGEVRTEVGGLRTEVGEVRTEVSELRTEVGGLRTEVGGLRTEVSELRTETRQTAEQLRSEFQHGFDDVKETMRDVQTELLKAFYSFAQSADAKLKETEIADIMLRQRLTAVEFRVTEIEKRINLPPQQTQ